MKPFGAKNFFKEEARKTFNRVGLFLVLGVLLMIIPIYSASAAVDAKERVDVFSAENNLEGEGDSKQSYNDKRGTINPFKLLLIGLQEALHQLTLGAAKIFDFVLWESSGVVSVESGYKAWSFVRDLLNLLFMLVLLFSAFATIFQVEKYHLKKMIVLLVVMALLVNFSYPITLFIIDFSNSLMYFLVSHLSVGGSETSKSVAIAKIADMGGMLTAFQDHTIANLILLNIFEFILFITIFAFAINLLVRMLAFVVLIIFSPAGFVFSFFPPTKSIADSWWSSLFKYAALGPIMIFFLILAYLMFDMSAAAASGNKTSLVKSMISFGISISFLWIGLIASNKFGAMASSAAMGVAKNTGNKIRGYAQKGAWGATKMGAGATGVPGGIKQRYTSVSNKLKAGTQAREARVASALGDKNAMSDLERKKFEEDKKKMKNFSNSDLEKAASGGNIAAAEELLGRNSLNRDVYAKTMANSKNESRNMDLANKFKAANKESRIDIVAGIDARGKANNETEISNMMASAGVNENKAKEMIIEREINDKLTSLDHSAFSKQDFKKIYEEIDVKSGSGNSMDRAEARALENSIKKGFRGLGSGQREAMKNLSASQRTTLQNKGVI